MLAKSGEQELEALVQAKKKIQQKAESDSILRSSSGTKEGVWRESVVHSAVRAIGPHMVSGKRIKGT